MASKNQKSPNDDLTFEATMESLETLLDKLESNETSLESSLDAFEAGIVFIRNAQKSLLEAEQRITLLTQKNGAPTSDPFLDEGA